MSCFLNTFNRGRRVYEAVYDIFLADYLPHLRKWTI